MLEALLKKMTNKMLWVVIIPTALLLTMFSFLIGAYTVVVWKSDEVSYDGAFGKFSARATNLETKLNEALAANHQLANTVADLKKLVTVLQDANSKISSRGEQTSSENKAAIAYGITDIAKNLNEQSNLLMDQQQKLEAVGREVMQFKQDLEGISKKHTKPIN